MHQLAAAVGVHARPAQGRPVLQDAKLPQQRQHPVPSRLHATVSTVLDTLHTQDYTPLQSRHHQLKRLSKISVESDAVIGNIVKLMWKDKTKPVRSSVSIGG